MDRRRPAVTWAMGAQFFRQAVDADRPPEDRHRRRAPARGRGLGAPHRRAHHHDEGRRGDRQRRRAGHRQPHRRASARKGSLKAPAGTRTIDVSGKTIMPGLVDAHAHMWAPRGLHQTEVWQYLRQPRLRRDDDARSADLDAGRVRIRRHGRGRRDARAAHLRDRPRRVLGLGHRGSRRGVPLHQALQGRVSHQHHQAVRRRRPHRAAVDHRGVQGVRHHGDDRGLARPEAEPHADGRRLLRPGAQPADPAALQGHRRVRGADQDLLHADDPRRLRRAVVRELLLRDRERRAAMRSCGRWVPWELLDSDDAAPAAVVPARGVRTRAIGKQRRRHRPRGRPRGARQPRPAAGAGRALGDVEPAVGRPDAARDAARRHDLRRRGHRHAAGRGLAGGRQDGGPASCSIATRSRTSATPTRSAT